VLAHFRIPLEGFPNPLFPFLSLGGSGCILLRVQILATGGLVLLNDLVGQHVSDGVLTGSLAASWFRRSSEWTGLAVLTRSRECKSRISYCSSRFCPFVLAY
jgi:hypothetical protein